MSDPDFPFRSGAPTGGGGSLRGAQDLIARVQRLIDLPRPAAGYPLAWYVEALNVGDVTAIAVASLRESGFSSVSKAR